ncbi:MAG: polysaccharide pyruvyl transferase family protein, partial [Planctomycetales bacterium]|nr:polysaccharide pyruvyl transferase family protein [Planctomycetales bacterium]
MDRRSFLSCCGLSTCGLVFECSLAAATQSRSRILLRSSWQTVNIGDIAHTPGVLSLLRKHLPDVEVTLWPSHVDNGVEQLLLT